MFTSQDLTDHSDIKDVLFSARAIAERVSELGDEITADYDHLVANGEDLVLVCLLRGSAVFMSDLVRTVRLPIEMDYMAVSSYGTEARSSGQVTIKKDLSCDIQGRHVIIVEDIIDSGLTLKTVCEILKSRGPLSVEIASMLRKDVPNQADIDCKYLGFICPDEFVVGYGLDYAERYRNLPEICALEPSVYM